MKDYFYRLQMKAGSKGKRIAEQMLAQNFITSSLETAGEDFEELQRGDILLIHKGAYPLSLVSIKHKIDEDDLSDESFGIDYEVEILSNYEELTKEQQIDISLWGTCPPTGSFSKINKGNNTFDRFNKWYLIILKNKYMKTTIELLKYKKQIILQGPPGTGKTYTAKDIAEQIIFERVTLDKKLQKSNLEKSNQFKLIQFHPAYSYEDFVRGITAKSNGTQVEYKTVNKVLAEFADDALKNFNDSNKTSDILSLELWIEKELLLFAQQIKEEIEKNNLYPLTDNVSIVDVDSDAFRYKGNNRDMQNPYRMKFKDTMLAYLANAKDRQEIKLIDGISGRAFDHVSYDLKLLEKFREFLKTRPPYVDTSIKIELKNYVLIIDEINRANLPAVLGELIYALEYRGDTVESMYDIDGDNSLVLPPNLYIIGTMNTADRSVGHIDYAIRRRFAFVDILPSSDIIDDVVKDPTLNTKSKDLFNKVATLFYEKKDENDSTKVYLQSDFKAKDVQLGHSYFLVKSEEELAMKLKYEIKPLLNEYIKDGILNEDSKTEIDRL